MRVNFINILCLIFILTVSFTVTLADSKDGILNLPKDLVLSYGDSYSYEIDFKYSGSGSDLKSTLSVTKEKYGFEVSRPYPKGNNIYSFKFSGSAKVLGTQKYTLNILNGSSKIFTGDINLKVVGLEFATTTFPTVYGINKTHTLQIPYTYSGKQLMRFSYTLPNSINYKEENNNRNTGKMNFTFTPTKYGNFKIDITALGDNPYGLESLVMARKTFTLVVKEKPDPILTSTTTATTTIATNTNLVASSSKLIIKPQGKTTNKKISPKKKIISRK